MEYSKTVTIEIDHTLPSKDYFCCCFNINIYFLVYRYWIAVGVSLCVLVLFAALMLLCSFVDGILWYVPTHMMVMWYDNINDWFSRCYSYRQHPVCQLLESGGRVAAVTPEGGGGEVGVVSLTDSEGLVKRPDFLSVLKGDYWYYQYKKRS